MKHCDSMKENVFDIMVPITFYVEVNDIDKPQAYNQTLQPFINFYQTLEESRERVKQVKDQIKDHKKTKTTEDDTPGDGKDKKDKEFLALLNNKNGTANTGMTQKITKFKTFNFEKRTHTRYSFPICHFEGYNMWLLKPTHLNRGRGIHVFRDLDTLHKLIKEYCQGKDEEVKVAPKKDSPNKPPEEDDTIVEEE